MRRKVGVFGCGHYRRVGHIRGTGVASQSSVGDNLSTRSRRASPNCQVTSANVFVRVGDGYVGDRVGSRIVDLQGDSCIASERERIFSKLLLSALLLPVLRLSEGRGSE